MMRALLLILLPAVAFGHLHRFGSRDMAGVAARGGLARGVVISEAAASVMYGSGLAADALNNTRIGGPWESQISYRFMADTSGTIESVKPYLIGVDGPLSGYSAGTGGSLVFSIQADDGTANHFPSGDTIATCLYANPMNGEEFPVVTFNAPATVVEGTLYHLTVFNPDASPTANYVSVDCLWYEVANTPRQPLYADSLWRELIKYSTDPWEVLAPTEHYTPIIELQYTGGHKQGNGYMEVWSEAPQPVSGDSSLRQNFTVSGSSKSVGSVMVRARKVSGSDPLTIRLETSAGALVEEGTVSVGASYEWATLTFASAHTLSSGASYNLVLQSPSSSIYDAFPIREGSSVNVGFDAQTYFGDGYAQFTVDGSTWAGWTMVSSDRRDADLQFLFMP